MRTGSSSCIRRVRRSYFNVARIWHTFDAVYATRPVPMIAFDGTADPMVPCDGGRFGDPFNPVKPVFPAVRDFVASWAARNGCVDGTIESPVAHATSEMRAFFHERPLRGGQHR